ncbi:Uncharacterised protein [Mycobacteroides abscessus subsp. abscessus]|nr:Uncharacterised protein [Mycobacteroides abscessus subsp. abscessus]
MQLFAQCRVVDEQPMRRPYEALDELATCARDHHRAAHSTFEVEAPQQIGDSIEYGYA